MQSEYLQEQTAFYDLFTLFEKDNFQQENYTNIRNKLSATTFHDKVRNFKLPNSVTLSKFVFPVLNARVVRCEYMKLIPVRH